MAKRSVYPINCTISEIGAIKLTNLFKINLCKKLCNEVKDWHMKGILHLAISPETVHVTANSDDDITITLIKHPNNVLIDEAAKRSDAYTVNEFSYDELKYIGSDKFDIDGFYPTAVCDMYSLNLMVEFISYKMGRPREIDHTNPILKTIINYACREISYVSWESTRLFMTNADISVSEAVNNNINATILVLDSAVKADMAFNNHDMFELIRIHESVTTRKSEYIPGFDIKKFRVTAQNMSKLIPKEDSFLIEDTGIDAEIALNLAAEINKEFIAYENAYKKYLRHLRILRDCMGVNLGGECYRWKDYEKCHSCEYCNEHRFNWAFPNNDQWTKDHMNVHFDPADGKAVIWD